MADCLSNGEAAFRVCVECEVSVCVSLECISRSFGSRSLVCVRLTSRHRRDRREDEILRPIVVPYAAAIGDNFILMDDNSSPHRANLVEDSLFEEGIVRMEWPACSPDMNPIEHVWDALGRRVAGRQTPPQTNAQ
ncbi:transposable element Tcb2 transposase [Trichonephila clavipes]|uniref:Transposable element Tcb2 transposase n=1 Tax=Trichonephila clavipes TaxID=2585209 RepID=A0A8X7BBR3_TRICX|nr:transposable element Tcb2 transposase [Trichonephila clavipes]